MLRIKQLIKISFVNALRDLIHIDLVNWHISHRFNCWVVQCYFYIGTLLTKTTFLLKLRVPAVPANEAYMCKALFSLQLNHYRTTIVKIFKSKSKLRILQKSQRRSIFLPLTNSINKGKRLYLRPVLRWVLLNSGLGTLHFPTSIVATKPSSRAAAPKKSFWKTASI